MKRRLMEELLLFSVLQTIAIKWEIKELLLDLRDPT